jgi:hypothetical protein
MPQYYLFSLVNSVGSGSHSGSVTGRVRVTKSHPALPGVPVSFVTRDVRCFRAYQPAPPSSSPRASQSSFMMCQIQAHSRAPPLPPLQRVLCNVPRFQAHTHAPPSSSPPQVIPVYDVPHFQPHPRAPLSSSPLASESSFVTCHVSELMNALLPLPPLQ